MSMVSLPGLKAMLDSMSRERNLPPEVVHAALQEALLKGYERYRRMQNLNGPDFPEEYFDNFQVELDLKAEGFRVVASKTVVEKVSDPDREIALTAVPGRSAKANPGDTVVVDVTPQQGDFGRLAVLQIKQVFSQKLQQQQSQLVKELFGDLLGTVFSARVLRLDRSSVIVGISGGAGKPEFEAELPLYDSLPNDNYRPDTIYKVYLKRVFEVPRSAKPLLRVSRATSYLVTALLTSEVPEIQQELVQIVAVSRDASPKSRSILPRTKIAVATEQPDFDPIAACMGERGSRLQMVVNELRGEPIELIRWSADPVTYIANAIGAELVQEVQITDAEARQALVLVAPDNLAAALGPDNQNLILAGRLTDWQLQVQASS